MREVNSRASSLLAVPGGPTSTMCWRASSATARALISSSRSKYISASSAVIVRRPAAAAAPGGAASSFFVVVVARAISRSPSMSELIRLRFPSSRSEIPGATGVAHAAPG